MKYKIVKENKPTLVTYGKYKAKAVHNQTVESRRIEEEAAQRLGVTRGDIVSVRMALWNVINDHLRQGDKVRLDDWGLLKLEIESEKVESPEVFNVRKHIRGVRLHFLPQSSEGNPDLYKKIKFERERR